VTFDVVDLGRRAAFCLGSDCGSCCEQEPRDTETGLLWRFDEGAPYVDLNDAATLGAIEFGTLVPRGVWIERTQEHPRWLGQTCCRPRGGVFESMKDLPRKALPMVWTNELAAALVAALENTTLVDGWAEGRLFDSGMRCWRREGCFLRVFTTWDNSGFQICGPSGGPWNATRYLTLRSACEDADLLAMETPP